MIIEQKANQAYEQGYVFQYYKDFDLKRLKCVPYKRKPGRQQDDRSFNDAVIMADTETSKKVPGAVEKNHVCAWTVSVRAHRMNICTIWGHRPDTHVEFLEEMHDSMDGNKTIIYYHNLAYDWIFLRRFMINAWGEPVKQLNTKPHYPIFIEFENGIILRDSYILSQRSLEKWGADMNVDHSKAVGKWDYDRIRNQHEEFSPDELEYIEHDTLCGVECIDKLRIALNKHIYSIPYTATGIVREECRKRGNENRAHDRFLKMVGSWEQQQKLEMVYHGGYSHANRYYINRTITAEDDGGLIVCRDFASSYPFCMLCEKFPCEKFHPYGAATVDEVLEFSETYCCIFKLIMTKPRLKNGFHPMPALQYSKCVKAVNPVLDNGRILCAGYVEIYLADPDLHVIISQYDYDKAACLDVELSRKDYLPRWFRDYVFECFKEKTHLKGGDPVAYALAKSRVNSLYGLSVQKPVRDEIYEDYETGLHHFAGKDCAAEYDQYTEKRSSILPYFYGVFVTSWAFLHLFQLGSCVNAPDQGGAWLYSDTDSCYAIGWDEEKVEEYNNECKKKLLEAGYGAVLHDGREYWLGVAETDGKKDQYTEFRMMGSKRYCGRCVADGDLHITVAGVPKKTGARCLNDDINNFTPGMIFDGKTTGKKGYTYFFDDIYTDDQGNITGDSIDLSPCDYLLDAVEVVDWQQIFTDTIEIENYEDET